MYSSVLAYYANPQVKAEIARYCKDRWVAVHCEKFLKNRRLILLRYYRGEPIIISHPEDVDFILEKFKNLKPRTFYATANLYFRISSRNSVFDYIENVYARTMFWDIDSKLEWWSTTLKIAKIIVQLLETYGVRECRYI